MTTLTTVTTQKTPTTRKVSAATAIASPPTATAPAEDWVHVARLQADDARRLAAELDPQRWLFDERSAYLRQGRCDPYAELMLRTAGFLPGASLV